MSEPEKRVAAVMRALELWLIARTVPTATENFRKVADAELRTALLDLI